MASLVSHSIILNYYHISKAHLAASNPALQAPRRKPGQLASKFQTDKSGKLIITDDNSADEADPSASAGAAFMANVANTTADGTYRDSRGNLKFNRNTKRAREAEGDILRGLDEEDAKKENKMRERKKMRKQLGEEFRAKVCFPPRLSALDADWLFLSEPVVISNAKEDLTHTLTSLSDRQRGRRERKATSTLPTRRRDPEDKY